MAGVPLMRSVYRYAISVCLVPTGATCPAFIASVSEGIAAHRAQDKCCRCRWTGHV